MEIRLIHSNSKNKTRHRLGTFVNTCLSFFENLGCVRNPGQVYGMKNELKRPKISKSKPGLISIFENEAERRPWLIIIFGGGGGDP